MKNTEIIELSTLPAALTEAETKRLERNEKKITKGLGTFIEVGDALADVRDAHLYRGEYATFEDYTLGKWGLGKAAAYRHIAASDVVHNIEHHNIEKSPGGDKLPLPVNESQARPLAMLPAEQQGPAWQQIVEATPAGEQPTREAVAETVAKIQQAAPVALGGSGAPPKTSWTDAELKEDAPLKTAFYRIELAMDDKDARKAMQNGTVGLTRKDVLFLAGLQDSHLAEVGNLVIEKRWSPKKAHDILNGMVTEKTTMGDLINRCIGGGGSFEATVNGFKTTVLRVGKGKR